MSEPQHNPMYQISATDLSLDECNKLVATPKAGAISNFIGVTRGHQGAKSVTELHYEAYIPMALKVIAEISEAAQEKFEIEKVALHHRIGVVPVGEASVIISVSSAHRAPSLDACRFLIEELKEKVPIWKKEIFTEGDPLWLANRQMPIL